jgi:hypothetical protein
MFGRGGSIDFGNMPSGDHHHTIAEEDKKAEQEILSNGKGNAQ